MSESDVHRRQILTYKVGPHTERVEVATLKNLKYFYTDHTNHKGFFINLKSS